MVQLLLIRHGHTEAVGRRLVGRMPNVPLDALGREEASRLAVYLAKTRLDAVYSSPIERALETARAIAAPHGLEVERRDRLTELDFGEWTGALVESLRGDAANRHFNVHRAGNRAAGGEHGVEVLARMAVELTELRDRHADGIVAVVGHADPLRAALAHFIGVPLDLARRFELDTGSVTRLDLWPEDASLRYVNRLP
jgi:broad specificity phosphatase PhoE